MCFGMLVGAEVAHGTQKNHPTKQIKLKTALMEGTSARAVLAFALADPPTPTQPARALKLSHNMLHVKRAGVAPSCTETKKRQNAGARWLL